MGVVGEGWPKGGVGLRAEIIRVRIENADLEITLRSEIHLGHGGPLADWPVVDVVAHEVARLPGAKGQIDEIARVGEKLVAEREAADCGLEPVVEPFLIPGELLQPEDVAAPEDFVEQLKRRDAGVRGGVSAPAIHQRHQEPGALETQTLLQVEFGLQGDLPSLLGYAALAAGEVHHRFVDAGDRDIDAEIAQLRADAWPFAEKMWRGREIIGRQRRQDEEGRGTLTEEALEADTTGGAEPCAS